MKEPGLVALDLSDGASALMDLRLGLQLLEEPVVVDLSGGMRIICALTPLALLISRKRFELYVESESGEAGELYVPPELLERLQA